MRGRRGISAGWSRRPSGRGGGAQPVIWCRCGVGSARACAARVTTVRSENQKSYHPNGPAVARQPQPARRPLWSGVRALSMTPHNAGCATRARGCRRPQRQIGLPLLATWARARGKDERVTQFPARPGPAEPALLVIALKALRTRETSSGVPPGRRTRGPRSCQSGPIPGQTRAPRAAVPAWPAINELSTTGPRLPTLADARRYAADLAWMSYLNRPCGMAGVALLEAGRRPAGLAREASPGRQR
jgi:hypothetical protein